MAGFLGKVVRGQFTVIAPGQPVDQTVVDPGVEFQSPDLDLFDIETIDLTIDASPTQSFPLQAA